MRDGWPNHGHRKMSTLEFLFIVKEGCLVYCGNTPALILGIAVSPPAFPLPPPPTAVMKMSTVMTPDPDRTHNDEEQVQTFLI